MSVAPILVVGTGRSATSRTAKALIELGVYMGTSFRPATDANPEGHFEDVDFWNVNRWRFNGEITVEDWRHAVRHLAAMRRPPWGFKDPMTAHFLPDYIALLSPRFVWCRRPEHEFIASCRRHYDWTAQAAKDLFDLRHGMCASHLKGQDVLELWVQDWTAGKAEAQLKEFVT